MMRKLLFLFLLFPILVFSQSGWEIDNTQGNAFIKNEGQFDGRNWQKNTTHCLSCHFSITDSGASVLIRRGTEKPRAPVESATERGELEHGYFCKQYKGGGLCSRLATLRSHCERNCGSAASAADAPFASLWWG
jgi:hypothetical protein